MKWLGAALLAVAAFALGGCGGGGAVVERPVYFVVSEIVPWHGDSYLLPLTKAEDIARARALVRGERKGGTIVVARIARGANDGFTENRDVLGGHRNWSWHVSEFVGFADATIEILDGWPGYVEANLEEWMRITGGMVGFWSYTVTAEWTG